MGEVGQVTELAKTIQLYGLAAICAVCVLGFSAIFAFMGWFLKRLLSSIEIAHKTQAAWTLTHEREDDRRHTETRKEIVAKLEASETLIRTKLETDAAALQLKLDTDAEIIRSKLDNDNELVRKKLHDLSNYMMKVGERDS